MAKGNKIVVSERPKGVTIEGFMISQSPKPGTVMEIDWSVAAVSNRFAWEPWGVTGADGIRGVGADGDRRLMAVLIPDPNTGQASDTAYVSAASPGTRCHLYVPVAGEMLNMLVLDISGTGDDLRVGDIMIVNDGDGKLIETTGDPESEPFIVLEALTDPMADTLVWCMYTGQ